MIENHSAATVAVEPLSDYEAFLSRLGDRDRQNIERHMTVCETESTTDHATLWKRLACTLARLAPHAVQTAGQRAIRFFVPDGAKFRRQIFALEDLRDSYLVVYLPDVLKQGVQANALRGPISTDGDVMLYEVCDQPGLTIKIEMLTAGKTASAPEYFKHMLGWNRKALKIRVPITAAPALLRALETLCIVAARHTKESRPRSRIDRITD